MRRIQLDDMRALREALAEVNRLAELLRLTPAQNAVAQTAQADERASVLERSATIMALGEAENTLVELSAKTNQVALKRRDLLDALAECEAQADALRDEHAQVESRHADLNRRLQMQGDTLVEQSLALVMSDAHRTKVRILEIDKELAAPAPPQKDAWGYAIMPNRTSTLHERQSSLQQRLHELDEVYAELISLRRAPIGFHEIEERCRVALIRSGFTFPDAQVARDGAEADETFSTRIAEPPTRRSDF